MVADSSPTSEDLNKGRGGKKLFEIAIQPILVTFAVITVMAIVFEHTSTGRRREGGKSKPGS